MKLVTAINKPFKLEDVRSALTDLGLQGLTVTEVKVTAVRRGTPKSTAGRIRGELPAQDQSRSRRPIERC